mmetsp:Transcript_69052/g.192950  ORF Transcript_69052/g.192950 Transcript_69052/m.192950 type:complete len:101 (-) Transcript_69052:301-603(-)
MLEFISDLEQWTGPRSQTHNIPHACLLICRLFCRLRSQTLLRSCPLRFNWLHSCAQLGFKRRHLQLCCGCPALRGRCPALCLHTICLYSCELFLGPGVLR